MVDKIMAATWDTPNSDPISDIKAISNAYQRVPIHDDQGRIIGWQDELRDPCRHCGGTVKFDTDYYDYCTNKDCGHICPRCVDGLRMVKDLYTYGVDMEVAECTNCGPQRVAAKIRLQNILLEESIELAKLGVPLQSMTSWTFKQIEEKTRIDIVGLQDNPDEVFFP